MTQPSGGASNPQNFCQSCGWLLKRSRYIDVSTNSIVEKMACTNGNCQTNKRR